MCGAPSMNLLILWVFTDLLMGKMELVSEQPLVATMRLGTCYPRTRKPRLFLRPLHRSPGV